MSQPSVINRSIVAIIAGVLLASICQQAFAHEPDPMLLRIKGYSPELIRFSNVQRSRQEWKEPVPQALTPIEQFMKNVVSNNWTGSFDEFGYEVIRDY